MRRGILLLAVPALAAFLLVGWQRASGTTNGNPNSIAALGDSITRAFDADPSIFGDQPQNSWSTGTSAPIQSHYLRILQSNSLINGKNFNYAVSGAKMTDLNGQAANVNSTPGGVEYVTILMGGNDVCTVDEASMTPVATFRSQFQTALNTLTAGSPQARIFLASVPDVYQLWQILHTDGNAVLTWNLAGICQSMLVNPTSTAQVDVDRRARVRQRNIDFNTQLAQVCAQYTQCRWDNAAVFSSQFVPSDVSTFDYFHPSLSGQTKLAAGTWALSDSDGDGWSARAETTIGTDPGAKCATNPAHNANPADLNNDTFFDITDITMLAADFGRTVPPAPARHDVWPDPPDGRVDITDIVKLAGLFGKSC